MFAFHDERHLDFTPEQLYKLVLDVSAYPEFLPWCAGARIVEHSGNIIIADLMVEFKIFAEGYRSRITYSQLSQDNYSIQVEAINGPFRYLRNSWQFIKLVDKLPTIRTQVIFDIDFAFKSNLLGLLASNIFIKTTKKMIHAFEQRAKEIYVC